MWLDVYVYPQLLGWLAAAPGVGDSAFRFGNDIFCLHVVIFVFGFKIHGIPTRPFSRDSIRSGLSRFRIILLYFIILCSINLCNTSKAAPGRVEEWLRCREPVSGCAPLLQIRAVRGVII